MPEQIVQAPDVGGRGVSYPDCVAGFISLPQPGNNLPVTQIGHPNNYAEAARARIGRPIKSDL